MENVFSSICSNRKRQLRSAIEIVTFLKNKWHLKSEEILCHTNLFPEIPVNKKNTCKMKMQINIAEKNISDKYVIHIIYSCPPTTSNKCYSSPFGFPYYSLIKVIEILLIL